MSANDGSEHDQAPGPEGGGLASPFYAAALVALALYSVDLPTLFWERRLLRAQYGPTAVAPLGLASCLGMLVLPVALGVGVVLADRLLSRLARPFRWALGLAVATVLFHPAALRELHAQLHSHTVGVSRSGAAFILCSALGYATLGFGWGWVAARRGASLGAMLGGGALAGLLAFVVWLAVSLLNIVVQTCSLLAPLGDPALVGQWLRHDAYAASSLLNWVAEGAVAGLAIALALARAQRQSCRRQQRAAPRS